MDAPAAADSPSGRQLAQRKRKIADPHLPASSTSRFTTFEWEAAKENVMPLKRGRHVPDLNRALRAQDSFQEKLRLEQHAQQLENELKTYAGDDPLALWLQYIRWIEAKMPEDTRKKFAVLEKCTRVLKENARYKDDLRYIRVWIQYADLVANPKDIFKYLYQNRIGEHVSLFYVGWAWVLESTANYAQAHKVYLKATQKKAEPQELLARKYKEFQRRMTRHWQKMNEESAASSGQEVNQRFALENLSAHSAEFAGLVDANQRQQQAFDRAQNVRKVDAHKPVFTVYEDPAGHEVDFFESSADWQMLASRQHQNKENEVAASKWNHQSLSSRQPGHVSANIEVSSLPERGRIGEPQPLQVFVDDEFTAVEAPRPEVGLTNRSCTLRQRIDGAATEEELLAKKPLKNFDSKDAKTANSNIASKPSKRSQSVKELKSERLGYDLEKLKTSAGEVLSFEEARAQAFLARAKRRAPPAAADPPQNRFLATQSSSYQPMNAFLESSAAADTSIGFDGISRRLSFATTSKKPSPHRAVVSKAEMAALDHAAQEDMTINTRVAMSEVNDMFCSPERQQEVKVWDIREEHHPVERKLHFSVFDDSVESVAPSAHEQSVREDTSMPVGKHSFSIFSDEVAPAPPTDSKSKSQHRKPLGSREDLLRSVRRTNKDVLLQLRQEVPDKSEDSESKDQRAPEKVHHSIAKNVTPDAPKRRRASRGSDLPATKKQKILNQKSNSVASVASGALTVDPYNYEIRRKMIQDERVDAFLAQRSDAVHVHALKLPVLPCQNMPRQKLKKPVKLKLSASFEVNVTGHLGSGAFAHVFSVTVGRSPEHASSMALKRLTQQYGQYEKHRSNLQWEFYVTNQIRTRLACGDTGLTTPIANFHRLDVFRICQDGSMLFMEKSTSGTLHDLLNCYKKLGRAFPEHLAVYYTIKMVRSIEILHEAQVLHGDVKPDNWLVVPGSSASVLHTSSKPEKADFRYHTGDLSLIDFGRAIDLAFFPPGTTFVGDCHTKGFQTTEMISSKPWTKQIDTFGICATTHCMLFGEYMDVVCRKDRCGREHWGIKKSFKRYWDVSMWKELFDTLLNVKSCAEQPSLSLLRQKLEAYFKTSPQREQELHELLGRQDRFFQVSKV